MTGNIKSIKQNIIEYGRKLLDKNLVVGPGGNISARHEDHIFVTPSGLSFDEMTVEDLVTIDINTKEIIQGDRRPTSETPMHRDIFMVRKDISCVIHTHPPITVAVSGAGARLRPQYPDFALFLGPEVPAIDYVTVCTQDMADAITKVIKDKNINALILKKHGLITLGSSFKEAFIRTMLIEETAKMIVAARTIGKESTLTDDDIEDINNLEIERYRKKILNTDN